MFTHLVAVGLLAIGAAPSQHPGSYRSALKHRPAIVQGPRRPIDSSEEVIVTESPESGSEYIVQEDGEAFAPPRRSCRRHSRSDDCWRDTNCDAPIGSGGYCSGRPACGLPQHYAYLADPKFYYYFRPYNWFHIEPQQDEVENYGLDRRNPYDNRFLQAAYERVEAAHPTIGQAAEPIDEGVAPPHFLPAPEEKPAVEPPGPEDPEEPAIETPQDEPPAVPKASPRRPRTSGSSRLPLLPARRTSDRLKFRNPSRPQDAPTDDMDTVGQPRWLHFVAAGE